MAIWLQVQSVAFFNGICPGCFVMLGPPKKRIEGFTRRIIVPGGRVFRLFALEGKGCAGPVTVSLPIFGRWLVESPAGHNERLFCSRRLMTGGKKKKSQLGNLQAVRGYGIECVCELHRKSDCVGLRASGSEWSLVKHARLLEEEEH